MELRAILLLIYFDLFSKHWLILYRADRLSEHQSEASGCGAAMFVLKCI